MSAQPQVGSDDGFVVDGPWSALADALEIRHAKTVDEVIEHARWLVESYKGMCDRLRVPVKKYNLGLGGENLDSLVIEALDAALSANAKGMSLRDWLAGQALMGDAANSEGGCWPLDSNADYILKRAQLFYRIADAMLAAREGGAA